MVTCHSKSIMHKPKTPEKHRWVYLCFGILLMAVAFSFPAFASDPEAIIHDVNGKGAYEWQNSLNLSINITTNATSLDSWNLSIYNTSGIVNLTNNTLAKNSTYVNLSVPTDGNYTINLTVFNSTAGFTTALFSLGVDNTTPQVAISSPTPNSSQASRDLTIDFNVTETNLDYTNISIYNSTGGIVNSTNTSATGSNEANLSVALDGVYSVNITSYDLAGHSASALSTNLIIDATAPYQVNITLNASIVNIDESINVTCTAEDLIDDNLSIVYNNATTSVPGVGRINCTATDHAGNVNVTSRTYIVNDTSVIIMDENVSVNETQTQVIVTANNTDSNITVPGSVTNSTLDLSAITEIGEDEVTATLNGSINVSSNTSAGVVEVQIPANVTVNSSSDWKGIIGLPRIASSATVTVTPDSGKTATVSVVVEVGAGNVPLNFDKAIRLLIPGQAGKDAGYYRNGIFTKIASICSDDSQGAGNNLSAGGECKIDSNLDLVIWTKHFTSFVTYTQANAPSGNNPGGSSGASSFSSSVGSTPVFWTLTKAIEADDFAAGYTITLAERQRMSFLVGNETHHAGLINFTSEWVIVNISSTPQQITLYPGDSAKFDINDDAYYDVYIKLNSIDSNRSTASLTIKSIFEAMPVPENPVEIETPVKLENSSITPLETPSQACAPGEMRCEPSKLQSCENGNWQTIELCPLGCTTSPYGCIKETVPEENPPILQVSLIIILLLLVALAAIVSKKKKEPPLLENKALGNHKAILHSKVKDLEQRVAKLERKGENMNKIKLVVEEIKQDLSDGLHYIAEGRLETLNKEMAFIEAI